MQMIQKSEELRVERLHHYAMIDTPQEKIFDHITSLAASICQVKGAFLSFVDEESTFIKSSNEGWCPKFMDRHESISSYIVLSGKQQEFIDIAHDPVLSRLESVKNGAIRYFAGVPLLTPDDHSIGVLGVYDNEVRSSSPQRLDSLGMLAQLVMDVLNARLSISNILQEQQDILNATVHDVKNPLTTVRLNAQLIIRETSKEEGMISHMASRILEASDLLSSRLDVLIKSAKDDAVLKDRR